MMRKSILILLVVTLLLSVVGCQGQQTPADGEGQLTCTLEIRCDTLLDHLDEIQKEKAELVPEDGIILAKVEVKFQSGQTAFDVLRKTLREKKIHFEYEDASVYNAIYIEGIGNLYEYDCGPQSGWMYSVNGVYPSLGCSSYTLSDGDAIVFSYTCDLGADLGAENKE